LFVGATPVVIGVFGVLAANIFVLGAAGASETGTGATGAFGLGCVLNLTSDGTFHFSNTFFFRL
jgi:hypothetical protein